MAKLQIRYRLEGKALPPRQIRIAVPGWGGSAEMKKETGSEPQPWHCPLFVEGSTHGVELLYPYDTECQIVNENGELRIVWGPAGTPGDGVDPKAFTLSVPKPSQNYLFNTTTDLRAPPGYVLRTEPHPRYFADLTGTSPAALYGHVHSEWWPKQLFVVFKIPLPGQRHIFRKGEPYAQVLFIPEDEYELAAMESEELAARRKLEREIALTKSLVAKNVWNSGSGMEFNDHYKVLSRAYERDGLPGVEALVRQGVERFKSFLPRDKTPQEYLDLATRYQSQGRRIEAKEVLHFVMRLAPDNAEAYNRMAWLEWEIGVRSAAVVAMARAAGMQPQVPQYHGNLGEMLRRLGRFAEARAAFEAALRLSPADPTILTGLGLTLSQSGAPAEGLEYCRRAAEVAPGAPAPRFVRGVILAGQNRPDEARASYEAALALDPNYLPAREALRRMEGASAPPT